MRKIFRVMIVTLALAVGTSAQITAVPVDHEDLQSWNDFQLTVPMNKQIDFLTKLTLRFGNNVTRLNDGRFTIGFVWKPVKAFSISPSYTYVDARNAAGRFRIENRLSLAAAYHFPIKRFSLLHRSTVERRLRRPLNSWRYRAQLAFEKGLPEKFIPMSKLFISDELFYDSLTERFSKNRLSIGVIKKLTDHLSLDMYYMRQNDGIARPGDLNIIGTTWKIKL